MTPPAKRKLLIAATHGDMTLYREAEQNPWGNDVWGISYGAGRGISGPILGDPWHHWRLATDDAYADRAAALITGTVHPGGAIRTSLAGKDHDGYRLGPSSGNRHGPDA